MKKFLITEEGVKAGRFEEVGVIEIIAEVDGYTQSMVEQGYLKDVSGLPTAEESKQITRDLAELVEVYMEQKGLKSDYGVSIVQGVQSLKDGKEIVNTTAISYMYGGKEGLKNSVGMSISKEMAKLATVIRLRIEGEEVDEDISMADLTKILVSRIFKGSK